MVLSRVRVAGLGAKTFIQGHERRTAGRFAEAETGLPEHPPDKGHGHWRWRRYRPWPLRSLRRSAMLTGLQADIGIQLCRDDVLRQTASSPMTYHTAIQMRQRMRVSSSFSEQKRCGERSAHSQFSSDFRNCGASKQGRAPQLNCIKPCQEYSKKETAECVFLLTQDALCDSRGTHSADFFLS